jgi:hypothetical protein
MTGGARLSARVSTPARLFGPSWATLACWAGPSWSFDLGFCFILVLFIYLICAQTSEIHNLSSSCPFVVIQILLSFV